MISENGNKVGKDSYYIHNRETGKLELHFDKSEYDAMTDEQRSEIKSAFLWGRRSGCWISRAKEPNLWRAERVAQSIGLGDGGEQGERLSKGRSSPEAHQRPTWRYCLLHAAQYQHQCRAGVYPSARQDVRGV